MLIRIKNGTFGYREKLPDGTFSVSVQAKTPQDPPFYVDDEIGVWLITEGIAEAADETPVPAVATAIPDAGRVTPGNDTPDAETAAEGSEAAEPKPLEDMSFQQLRTLAEDMGINTRPLRSKASLIDAINAFDEEAEDDGEQLPALDAGDMFV